MRVPEYLKFKYLIIDQDNVLTINKTDKIPIY